MAHWLVIGGGPDKTRWASFPADKIITANRGLSICPKPDVYWLSDPMAIERYAKLWKLYDGEIICNADLGRPTTRWPYLNAGLLYHGSASGICCMRVALERGATKLTLVGFQGHNATDMINDTNDKPWISYGDHAARRNASMSASFAAIAAQYPLVGVRVIGPTQMVLPENWRME